MKFYSLILLSTVFGDAVARRVGKPRARGKGKKPGYRGNKQGYWSGSHGSTRSAGSFNDGVKKGCEEAEQSWKDYGSDCSNISLFHSHIDAYINGKYVDTGNWKVQAYNRGVRAGADQVVDKYEKQCITQIDEPWHGDWGDDGHEAITTESPTKHPVWHGGWSDDGHEAIVTDSPTKHPVWQGGWNDDGHGAITTESPTEHPTKHPTWHGDEWGGSGWGDDGYEAIITESPTEYPTKKPTEHPTRKPTSHPTRNPTPKPTPHPSHKPTPHPTSHKPTPSPTSKPTPSPTVAAIITDEPTKWQGAWGDDGYEAVVTDSPTHEPTEWHSDWGNDGHEAVITDSPTYEPTSWGGSGGHSSLYDAGYEKGQEEAEGIWQENGSDCSYVWTFQDDVDSDIEATCSENSSFCRGVKAGADNIVLNYEEQCLDDVVDECVGLGEAASQEIAFEYCPFSASAAFSPEMQPDYKQSCREAAYGICKGAVGKQANENGCDDISTTDLLAMQEKCQDQVDKMTGVSSAAQDDGWGDDGYEAIITDSPTNEPTTWNNDWSGAWGAWKQPISERNAHTRAGKRKGHHSDWN